MQVVILAGGEGTRLRPLTHKVPKAMVKVSGKPFLQYQLELVKSYGFTDVLILAAYLGKQIEDYFGNGSDLAMNIKYSYEETPMGTGGALKNAEDLLDKSFILLNGDTLLPIDYNELVEQFRKCDKTGLIIAYNNAEKIAPSNLRITDTGIVLAYSKETDEEMTHLDAGATVLKRRVLKSIPAGAICSLEKEIFPKLIEAREFGAIETVQRFYDMGSFEGLKIIEKVFG